jgi:phosphonate dehydrogenase
MAGARVVVTHWVHPEVLDRLRQFCDPVAPSREQAVWSREEVLARANAAEGLMVCMADRVDAALVEACPRLRVVSGVFKAHNTVDVAACARQGVHVTVLPELLTAPTAELAMALVLALRRRVLEGDAWVRAGRHAGWRPWFYGSGLAGATVGVIGMGQVGQAVGTRAAAFDARIVYTDPRPLPTSVQRRLAARVVALPELLATSDVVLPLVPLTDATRHLIDADALGRLRPGACVVNVGRGSLVDEHAVAAALENNGLGGYAADVFAFEDSLDPAAPREIPPALLAHPRTVFTPHLGSAVDDVRRAMGLAAAEQVRQGLAGQRPDGAVTPPSGTRPGSTPSVARGEGSA